MRLYLSSFRLGNRPDRLVGLVAGVGPVAVIGNAADAAPDDVRGSAVTRELAALAELGLDPVEVDLRAHRDDPAGWTERLGRHAALWVRGGNTFVLREALALSGADVAIAGLLRDDRLVYAGYSAGACVLARSLRGLELVDDPSDVERAHGRPARWDGLGVLESAIVPHVASPGHPETEDCDRLAAHYRQTGMSHVALRDGQALVVHGTAEELVG